MSHSTELADALRTAWHRFVDDTAPLRPALHGYCRRLTGHLWDAEDLAQDTLLRAFGQWGTTHPPIRNPRAYLLRTATTVWIDAVRRRDAEARATAPARDAGPEPAPDPAGAIRLRDAGARLLQRLSPQERAAVVLTELFDMPVDDVAAVLATTPGAVKAALHRGRHRLRAADDVVAHRSVPSRALVDRFVDGCRAADVDGLLALMLETATAVNVGNSAHAGRDPDGLPHFLGKVVHGHAEWPAEYRPEATRMAAVELEGEPIVLVFATRRGREKLEVVFRFDEVDGRVARLRAYGFCPETMRAVGELLGLPVRTGLYRAPTPAPGASWPA